MSYKHGMCTHKTMQPEYKAYNNAKQRCTNPNYKGWHNYGGRGIKFLFTNFEQFFAELGRRPKGKSLDRKDNDKPSPTQKMVHAVLPFKVVVEKMEKNQ